MKTVRYTDAEFLKIVVKGINNGETAETILFNHPSLSSSVDGLYMKYQQGFRAPMAKLGHELPLMKRNENSTGTKGRKPRDYEALAGLLAEMKSPKLDGDNRSDWPNENDRLGEGANAPAQTEV